MQQQVWWKRMLLVPLNIQQALKEDQYRFILPDRLTRTVCAILRHSWAAS